MPTFDNHPIYSWDNFLDSVYANPLVQLGVSDGTSEQIFSLSSGRRSRNPTPWKPGNTADVEIILDLGATVSKAANLVWLDRGHNYDGEGITLSHATVGITGPWTDLFTNKVVGTDGKDLDDLGWAFLFEGTETSKQFWRVRFENVGLVDVNVPGLYVGRVEQFSNYWVAPIDETAGRIIRTGVEVSDAGVRSAAVRQRKLHTMEVRLGDTDEVASEFSGKIEPWLDHITVGGLTLLVPDWLNAGKEMRLYQLDSDRVAGPFTVRGRHQGAFFFEEIA